jgi:hypothetical protein
MLGWVSDDVRLKPSAGVGVGCGFGIGWGFGGELLLSARLAMLKVLCSAVLLPAWSYCWPRRLLQHQFHMQQALMHLCVFCVALLCCAGGSIGFGGLGAGESDSSAAAAAGLLQRICVLPCSTWTINH